MAKKMNLPLYKYYYKKTIIKSKNPPISWRKIKNKK